MLLIGEPPAAASSTPTWSSVCYRIGPGSSGDAFCSRNQYGRGKAIITGNNNHIARAIQGFSSGTLTRAGIFPCLTAHLPFVVLTALFPTTT